MTGARLHFVLPYALPVLNRALREHWSRRHKRLKGLAWEVRALTHGRRPPAPWPRARVTITRYGLKRPDHDGLVGGCKSLLDVLVTPGPVRMVKGCPQQRHPYGLAVIQDDNPSACELIATSVQVSSRQELRTEVLVEEIR
ncbi:hypothetical protein UFOVP326_98 [uncultured Caudovirales phage]|uniref:Uncharacterized protein n=1 Tax=uncultured Caudovirales phage TaxID=2100421 RepID=A0A6J5LXC6_9CAUD|nr:hypothetical protein UFOVP326_98 [uncultured Caudovirales phage]